MKINTILLMKVPNNLKDCNYKGSIQFGKLYIDNNYYKPYSY